MNGFDRSRENVSPALEAHNISKRFGSVTANDSVSFSLRYGSIHALLGENGAGKSTLVSILYGLYQPDAGRLAVDGKAVHLRRPADALNVGVGLVQQHFSLIPALNVLDNLILGRERCSLFRLDRRKAKTEIVALLERYGLDLPLGETVERLPIGVQQRVEIARILYRNARIMLFDEPTAALVSHEVDRFLATLQTLKSEGIAIGFITHRLPEVLQTADEVTVLHKGRVVLQDKMESCDANQIVRAIVGEDIQQETYVLQQTGRTVIRLDGVSSRDEESRGFVEKITLDAGEREIVGIAGVAGNGQEPLIGAILGLQPIHSGKIVLNDEEIAELRPAERRKRGMALIPQDRVAHGLLLDHSITENFMLNRQAFSVASRHWLRMERIEGKALEMMDRFQVQAASPQTPAMNLSGGHQQRVLIARELMAEPKLIVAHDPTRGLDLRAARFVREKLMHACKSGACILLFSSELSELFLLCHRIAVLYRGKISQVRKTGDWTPDEMGKAMVGAG